MKKLLVTATAIALVASLPAPAFAAETNTGTAPTSITVAGAYKAAVDADEKISVDITWDNMTFTYDAGSKGSWDKNTHSYINGTDPGWSTKKSNITIANHSNTAVKAGFAWTQNSNVSGKIDGTFYMNENPVNSLTLESADQDQYREWDFTENTISYKAPKATVQFGISGDSISKAENALGTITVSIAKTTMVDATTKTAADMKAELTSLFASGISNVTVALPATGNTQHMTALAEALGENTTNNVSLTITGTTSIPITWLYENSSLKSISLPDVTTIGKAAFYACDQLTSVDCPSLTKIGSGAFTNCSALTSLSFPNVTQVDQKAFANCSSLSVLSFGKVITDWGTDVFYTTNNVTIDTGNMVLTLNKNQTGISGNTFQGYTFKEIKTVS